MININTDDDDISIQLDRALFPDTMYFSRCTKCGKLRSNEILSLVPDDTDLNRMIFLCGDCLGNKRYRASTKGISK